MKKILMLVVALTAVGSVEVEAQKNLNELVREGDVYMGYGLIRRNTLSPYTGDVIEVTENNRVLRRGSLRNGRWHGEYQSFMVPNGDGLLVPPFKGRYDNGQRCGTWTVMGDYTFEAGSACLDLYNSSPMLTRNCLTRASGTRQEEYAPCGR